MNINSELLKTLLTTYSPSGSEDRIRDIIENEVKDHVDEVKVDNLGNLICRKKGTGKKVMIAAHMDQIGFMITDIEKEGFLRCTNIGGISPLMSYGQKVIFENGTIGVVYAEEKKELPKIKLEDMYIDIGAATKEEAEKLVQTGDSCVYYSEYVETDERVISGALDDRIGCYIGIETLKSLSKTDKDIYFVFTVQEELGLRGAKTAAYAIEPDLGIALDITGSGDTPGANRFAVGLGKGAAIKARDNSIVVNPKVKNLMIDTAKANNIDYQIEVLEFGGTDSGAIHLSREGVLAGVISVPTRYVHSPNEVIMKRDVTSCIDLLTAILEGDLDLLN